MSTTVYVIWFPNSGITKIGQTSADPFKRQQTHSQRRMEPARLMAYVNTTSSRVSKLEKAIKMEFRSHSIERGLEWLSVDYVTVIAALQRQLEHGEKLMLVKWTEGKDAPPMIGKRGRNKWSDTAIDEDDDGIDSGRL